MPSRPTVILLGSYGRGNIGDDAFLLACVKLLEDFDLIINAAAAERLPREIQGRVQILQTDSLRDIRQKWRAFLSAQYIVYGGGDVWVELIGNTFPRQTLWKMVILNLAAKALRKRVFYLGCGIGSLHGLSLRLARLSAKMADYIIVREPQTAEILDLPHVTTLPDLTVCLFEHTSPPRQPNHRFRIGISLLYHVPNPKVNFPKLLEALAHLINSLDPSRHEVILLPLQRNGLDKKDDRWCASQLFDKVAKDHVSIFDSNHISDFLQLLPTLDLVVGARLHANILATLSGVPCVGISYRPKVSRFFSSLGLADFCLDLSHLNLLTDKVHQTETSYDQVRQQFAAGRQMLMSRQKGYDEFIDQHFN